MRYQLLHTFRHFLQFLACIWFWRQCKWHPYFVRGLLKFNFVWLKVRLTDVFSCSCVSVKNHTHPYSVWMHKVTEEAILWKTVTAGWAVQISRASYVSIDKTCNHSCQLMSVIPVVPQSWGSSVCLCFFCNGGEDLVLWITTYLSWFQLYICKFDWCSGPTCVCMWLTRKAAVYERLCTCHTSWWLWNSLNCSSYFT
jgi:hypothetical protein